MMDANGKRAENIELTVKKPMSMRIFRVSAGETTVTATNGFEGYKLIHYSSDTNDKLFVMAHEAVRKLMARAVENLYFFSGYENMKGGSAEYEGTESIDGKLAHKIRFIYPEGADQYLRYFDIKTGAVLATITNGIVRQIEKETMVVDGIRFPKQVDLYDVKNNEFMGSFIFTQVVINKRLSNDLFDFPSGWNKMEGWEKQKPSNE